MYFLYRQHRKMFFTAIIVVVRKVIVVEGRADNDIRGGGVVHSSKSFSTKFALVVAIALIVDCLSARARACIPYCCPFFNTKKRSFERYIYCCQCLFFRCWSYIGRRGGEQVLSLRPPDQKSCHCLCNVGRIMHEMMHALGFFHEHTRPDRDDYINIVVDNVRKGRDTACIDAKTMPSLRAFADRKTSKSKNQRE